MVESEVWFYWLGPSAPSRVDHGSTLENHMLQSSGIAIRITSRTFLVIDLVGLHASFRGHLVAWRREDGWVRG